MTLCVHYAMRQEFALLMLVRHWDGFRIRTDFLSEVILYKTGSLTVKVTGHGGAVINDEVCPVPQPKIDFA